MNNRVAILVHSCDLYEEAWRPFFALFKKYWSDCPFRLYLSSESSPFFDKSIIKINTGVGKWTKRLKIALETIEEDYVFLFLEDFFLQKNVNENEIKRALNIICENNYVACLYFNRITGYSEQSAFPNYTLMKPNNNTSRYMLNCQASLWRKNVLLDACSTDFSPWEFEEYGFDHLSKNFKKMIFLCYNQSYYDKLREEDIFPYLLVRDTGYGIWKSRWLWNNKKLFKENGIKFKRKRLKNYSHLSFLIDKTKTRLLKRIKNKRS